MTHKDDVKRAQAHAHHARQLSIPIGEPPTSAPAPETARPPPTTAPAPPTSAPAPPPPPTTDPAPPPPPPTTAAAPPPTTEAAPPPTTVIPTLTTSAPNRTTTVLSTADEPSTTAVVRSATTSVVLPVTTVSSARGASTIFNTVLTRVSSSNSNSALGAGATQTTGSGDGSPGAGTVVGAVAGALVGVVVLSGLIGYLFKAKFGKSKEEDEDDPFSRGNFRRESAMLPDEMDDGMSQISGGGRSHLGRSDTMGSAGAMSSGGGPRPPTFIQRHIYNTQPSPSFAPGQIVNPAYYGNTGFPREERATGDQGGWGVAAQYHQQQQPTASQAGSVYSDNLSRQGTMRSQYDQHDGGYSGAGHSSNLHGVREEEEDMPSRSGTPVNPNPQHAYYHHHDSRNTSTDQSSAGGAVPASIPYRGAAAATGGSRSRYSVRNGEYEEYAAHGQQHRRRVSEEDAYGGM